MNNTKKPVLPPRKWYTLQQTADKLTRESGELVTVADLLHFAVNGQLELCLYIGRENGEFSIYGANNEDIREIKYNLIENNSVISHEFLHSNCIINAEKENIRMVEKKEVIDKSKKLFFTNGFLAIEFYIMPFLTINTIDSQNGIKEKIILDNNNLTIPRVISKEKRQRFRIRLKCLNENNQNIPLQVDVDKIFILHDEIEKFINGESANEHLRLFARGFTQVNSTEKPIKLHKITEETQAKFIKDLLTIHYGEDVLNNLYSELDNPRGEIKKDFELKGLTPPTSKTVKKWLSKIEE